MIRNDNLRIFKYPLRVADEVTIPLPAGAQVLTVQVQRGQPCLWAMVDLQVVAEPRSFYIIGTGHPMPQLASRYVGTFQLIDGDLIFHVFEKKTGSPSSPG